MVDQLIKDLEGKTRAALEALKQEFAGIRTNRPMPQLVEDILVDYNGELLKIKQLGSISVVPPREIQVSVWDKNAVQGVVKAIEASPLRFIPSVDGKIIHLRLPPLTEERRQELMKLAKSITEKVRIKIRNLRDEANKKITQAAEAKTLSEDQKFKGKKHVQETIDKGNQEIENLLNTKFKEISE